MTVNTNSAHPLCYLIWPKQLLPDEKRVKKIIFNDCKMLTLSKEKWNTCTDFLYKGNRRHCGSRMQGCQVKQYTFFFTFEISSVMKTDVDSDFFGRWSENHKTEKGRNTLNINVNHDTWFIFKQCSHQNSRDRLIYFYVTAN